MTNVVDARRVIVSARTSEKRLPSFGQQYAADGPVGALLARLLDGEISEAEYHRLRTVMPRWRRVWEENTLAIFGATAYLAFVLWALFWR